MIKVILKTIAKTLADFVINDMYRNYEVFKKIITDKNINL